MRFSEGERECGEDTSARYSRPGCGRVSFRDNFFGDATTVSEGFGDPEERSEVGMMIVCGFAK